MTITYQIEITRTATKDIKKIWHYIAQDNQQAANRFIEELTKQINTLKSFPLRCATIPENEILKTNYRQLIYKQYRTIFRIDENKIYILRILHGAKLLMI